MTEPDVVDGPAGSWRVVLAVVALGLGIFLAALIGSIVIGAGGWDFGVDASLGAEVGRVAGQVGLGQEPDHNRIPLLVSVLLNLPLWAAFIGVPLIAAKTRGLDWRRDLGWGMRAVDVPVGLAIGVVTQLVLVPLLYIPILQMVDDADVEGPARDLVAAANSPAGVAALVVLTVVGAPIAEEILFRGVLHRGIVDMETGHRFAPVVAVVASSAIFAISHLQLLQFPGLFLIGAIAAIAFDRTGRLGTAIWIHVGFNATTIALLLPRLF